MRVKHLATKSTMAKNSATSWVRSTITKKEVEKATADGLIAAEDSIKFLAGVVLLYLMIKIASESAEIQESSADQFFQNTSAAHQVEKISR
jgi:hypothetical protein